MTAAGGPIATVTDWAIGLMDAMGGPGAGLAIAMENLFPPIPSEVILPLAGIAAHQDRINLVAAMGWTTAGSVLGALVLYGLGALLGRERLIAIADRMPLVKVSDIEKTEAWFARHGGKAVFFGRFVPLFRSFISIPAGLERMPLPRFLLYTATGSLIWNVVFIMIGYLLGDRYKIIADWMDAYSNLILVLVGIAVVVFIVVRWRAARRDGGTGRGDGDTGARAGGTGAGDHWRSDVDGKAGSDGHRTGGASRPGGSRRPGPDSHGNGYYSSRHRRH